MTPIARAPERRVQAHAWFFGVMAAAAASAGLTIVHAAPPIFLVMTALLLACVYALSALCESRRSAAVASLLLTLGWLLLAARPVVAPLSSISFSWILQPFVAALLAGCACLRASRWRRMDATSPAPAIAAAGFAALALLVLASNPRALGAAAATQIELLATGVEWLAIAWRAPAAASPSSALRRIMARAQRSANTAATPA